MARKRLFWQLCLSYLTVTVLAVVCLIWFAGYSGRQVHLTRVTGDLRARAQLVESQLPLDLDLAARPQVDALCKELGKRTDTRITVVLASGEVLGDSSQNPANMENHASRPEIAQALAGEFGHAVRRSLTQLDEEIYAALPVGPPGAPYAVVRTSVPVARLDEVLWDWTTQVVLAGVLVAVSAVLLSWGVSRRLVGPLEKVKHGAERFARGEFSARLPVPDSEELGGLAEAMNQMAEQLDERLRTVLAQRSELEAVFSSMVEGVLAVDLDERLLSLNEAAARMFGLDRAQAVGHSLQEVVRNADLKRFVARTLRSETPVEEGELVLRNHGERCLQVHGTLLRDSEGAAVGALVVLNDVTRLRRLEEIRRDFVANVSHELKTPITALKGAAETLLHGTELDAETRSQLLGIVARQTERLNSIVDDLLTLSRIEAEAQRAEIVLEESRLNGILQESLQVCAVKAAAREITLELVCPEGLAAKVNAHLLEQAVVNLVDNAIKYSDAGNRVRVEAARQRGAVTIAVHDQGCGIEKQHLSRVFERFYRVDKARSRKLGGTGLGLAIVKHIVQAHGGQVTVESTPKKGSVFTISLPACEGSPPEDASTR